MNIAAGHRPAVRLPSVFLPMIRLEFRFLPLRNWAVVRVALSVLILLASIVLGSAQSSLKTLEKISIAGNEYVRLLEWCDANDLKLVWTKKDEDLRATNRYHRLFFWADSRKTEIDGVTILFSLPIISRSSVPFISTIDLQTTLIPLLYPHRIPKSEIKTICIDAGHGGTDTGKIDRGNRDSRFEKTYTLLLAHEVSKLLQAENFKVVMVRKQDSKIKLSDRADVANNARADLFLCLHYNSAEDKSVRGVETYCMSPAGVESSNAGGGKSREGSYPGNAHNSENMLLAYQVHKTILRSMGLEDRGIKRARFEVLRDGKMPGILIEGGFMSNAAEAKKIYDSAWRKRMAQSIVDGVVTYAKLVEPEKQIAARKESPPAKENKKKTVRD